MGKIDRPGRAGSQIMFIFTFHKLLPDMDLNLHNKKALVCGSTQGIGWAAAWELASLGAEVTLLARNPDTLAQRSSELPTPQGQQHGYLVADFDHPAQVREAVAKRNDFHILVNNTGGPPGGPAIEADIEAYRLAFNNHLINNQLLAQAVVPFMRQQGYGRIINIISTSIKAPIVNLGVSNTIRGAVNSWSKTLAMELAKDGITVNNVLPGATKTERLFGLFEAWAARRGTDAATEAEKMKKSIPAGRFAEPHEVAAAVAFLATPAAGYINGVSIAVDGGRTNCL